MGKREVIIGRRHDPAKFDGDGNLKMAPKELFQHINWKKRGGDPQGEAITILAKWAYPDGIMNQDAAFAIPGNEQGHNGYSSGTTRFSTMVKESALVSLGEFRTTHKGQGDVGELYTLAELIPGRPKPPGVFF